MQAKCRQASDQAKIPTNHPLIIHLVVMPSDKPQIHIRLASSKQAQEDFLLLAHNNRITPLLVKAPSDLNRVHSVNLLRAPSLDPQNLQLLLVSHQAPLTLNRHSSSQVTHLDNLLVVHLGSQAAHLDNLLVVHSDNQVVLLVNPVHLVKLHPHSDKVVPSDLNPLLPVLSDSLLLLPVLSVLNLVLSANQLTVLLELNLVLSVNQLPALLELNLVLLVNLLPAPLVKQLPVHPVSQLSLSLDNQVQLKHRLAHLDNHQPVVPNLQLQMHLVNHLLVLLVNQQLVLLINQLLRLLVNQLPVRSVNQILHNHPLFLDNLDHLKQALLLDNQPLSDNPQPLRPALLHSL